MSKIKRCPQNPILVPNRKNNWEAQAVFNGSIVKEKDKYHLLYRAMSYPKPYYGQNVELSFIGYASSNDGINFEDRRLLISPEYKWEQYGCEDPRVTKLDDKYYIFYTALGNYPPSAEGIKLGVAITKDFKEIKKYQVTHFNSKGMALFPERIQGKIAVILSVNTDKPPAKTAIAYFDEERQLWSNEHWTNWRSSYDGFIIPLQRELDDQVEVGAPPIKLKQGWLLIFCHIRNYFSSSPVFGIEAALLDLNDPLKVISRTFHPLLIPEEVYELYGMVPNVIFPSGTLVKDKTLHIYYGAADTTCCLAKISIKDLLSELSSKKQVSYLKINVKKLKLEKHKDNPIIKPIQEHDWESKYTFNTAVAYEGEKVHLLYRAMGGKNTSTIGYASSKDGFKIDERLNEPIYVPRESFEKKAKEGTFSGCEDARISKVNDKFYMCYTAFNGVGPTQIALTSINVSDFLDKRWDWARPTLISCPDRNDKNACIMSEKIKGKYAFFHRIGGCIWLDLVTDLTFSDQQWLGGKIILYPRQKKWDSRKIGIAGPPHKTQDGWLLIYHGLSIHDDKYRLGALLLDLENPDKIIGKLDYPIIEPEEDYEYQGQRAGTVFSCGSVIIKDRLFVYYGAADQVICVASTELSKLLKELKKHKK